MDKKQKMSACIIFKCSISTHKCVYDSSKGELSLHTSYSFFTFIVFAALLCLSSPMLNMCINRINCIGTFMIFAHCSATTALLCTFTVHCFFILKQ